MKNIFSKFQEYVSKPKRNVFDLTFANNLTTKFGQLTPVFCKEVVPGDSFKIHSKFALQLMPMKFPVQTPMRAYLHFFYVRNRTLWRDWMDFIGGTKEGLVSPYVTPVDKKQFFRIGGLADYLGVPNVSYGSYGYEEDSSVANEFTKSYTHTFDEVSTQFILRGVPKTYINSQFVEFMSPSYYDTVNRVFHMPSDADLFSLVGEAYADIVNELSSVSAVGDYEAQVVALNSDFDMSDDLPTSRNQFKYLPFVKCADFDVPSNFRLNNPLYLRLYQPTQSKTAIPAYATECFALFLNSDGAIIGVKNLVNITETANHYDYEQVNNGHYYFVDYRLDFPLMNDVFSRVVLFTVPIPNGADAWTTETPKYQTCQSPNRPFLSTLAIGSDGSQRLIIYDDIDSSPYDSDIHLSALPFRAYEAIYNAYYRNPQNNPFILNGVEEYNRYNTTYEGGADTTQYDLYQRNWEYDFMTSAVQSPQQGIAPLVGISVTGEATFQDENGENYYASAIVGDDGEITGWQSHSPNMPAGSLRLLMDMAGTGISINDLRNVNAFQRFLENNIRHGLKYRDQVMSHFGVDIRYDELDMPEFIGGCSTQVDVYKISQTSESGLTPMGSFVGQGDARAESKHDITHYCDEHGFIMGILSVVPVPVYSQLLPKFFVKSTQLDYFFPEFGHIGYQPILQKEVSPLQTYYAGDDLNHVFGYQRAWYDYLASTDEVHSQFRTTMKDFVMNRTFDVAPSLGQEFLLVDPDQLNDVFLAGTDDDIYAPESDKIIGSLKFDVIAKRPIPLFGIPKLEG